ncbi:hypothetical protein BVRB_4g078390 [Beta vulgaris subsp. vulgaris]|nr:hypothetical protein BVRB_4g078390 [Beta vulgaris subsp. vulgaris]
MFAAAAERGLEAYTTEIMAGESSINTPFLLPDKELSFGNTSNSSPSELENRRKRCRTCEEPFIQQFAANQISSGPSDKILSVDRDENLVSWPQNFTFQSTGMNKSAGGFESKQSSFLGKNCGQLAKKSPSGIQRNLSNAGLFALHGNHVGSEKREDVEKSVDLTKEIEDAISRIESLIPSLQKLVYSAHSPKQKSVGNLGLPNFSRPVISTGKEKDRVITKNELGLTDKSSALSENMFSKQASQLLTKWNLPAPPKVKCSRNVECVNDDDMLKRTLYLREAGDHKDKEIRCSDVYMTPNVADKPLSWLSAQNDGRMRNFVLDKSLNARVTQTPRPEFKAAMEKSLESTPSRGRSFASHNPEHIEGLRIMPPQSYCQKAIEKDVTLKPCTQSSSVGSTNFMRQNRTNNMGTSHQKWSQTPTSGRYTQEKGKQSDMIKSRGSSNRNTVMRKNKNGDLHSKVVPQEIISEETSWSSCASSSVTTPQSGSPSSSSGTYESSGTDYYDSDESEPPHEKVSRSTRRKQPEPEVPQSSASGYADTSSYYNSQDEYSDTGPSSQMSSARCNSWKLRKERVKKRGGKLRRLKKRLGMIFHHHHHHHHHHYNSDGDEPDVHHARSFWKVLGEIFHHTKGTDHRQKPKAEKPRKSETKALVKRKQQGGHFHALVGGLIKHMKHSKNPKQVKTGSKGLGNGRHGGKKEGKNLPWWPKIHRGRGGVKMPNKGKVQLGNYYRTKSLAAAKMILKK